MSEDCQAWCLACGEEVEGKEPDTRKDVCPHCGEAKVYGPDELVLRNLVY